MARISGKVALITGGGTGIGRSCAELFAQEGARVSLVGRRKDVLDAAAASIANRGGEVMTISCDVSDRASVEAAIDATVAKFGQLHVVVNNAGMVVVGTVEQTSDADWDRTLAVNLTGTFLVSRGALPKLRMAGGGSIVNVASVLGLFARKQRAAYTASKGGVIGLTKAMALDHAHENIRVNCICPALVETELARESLSKAPDPQGERARRTAEVPMGRLGRPEDVAQLALYLASDESSWMTGVALPLDGGLTAY